MTLLETATVRKQNPPSDRMSEVHFQLLWSSSCFLRILTSDFNYLIWLRPLILLLIYLHVWYSLPISVAQKIPTYCFLVIIPMFLLKILMSSTCHCLPPYIYTYNIYIYICIYICIYIHIYNIHIYNHIFIYIYICPIGFWVSQMDKIGNP